MRGRKRDGLSTLPRNRKRAQNAHLRSEASARRLPRRRTRHVPGASRPPLEQGRDSSFAIAACTLRPCTQLAVSAFRRARSPARRCRAIVEIVLCRNLLWTHVCWCSTERPVPVSLPPSVPLLQGSGDAKIRDEHLTVLQQNVLRFYVAIYESLSVSWSSAPAIWALCGFASDRGNFSPVAMRSRNDP